MGLVKGAELYVEKYAPLKDPMELVLKGYPHFAARGEKRPRSSSKTSDEPVPPHARPDT